MRAGYHFLFLLAGLLLFGCKSNNINTLENGVFVDIDRDDKVSFFDIFSRIEIILLDTAAEAVLVPDRVVTKIIDGDIYILDLHSRQKLMIFGPDGKLKKKIEKVGRGPGEYLSLCDFNINRFTGNLELLSPFGSINIYDGNTGSFIKSLRLPPSELAAHYFHNVTEDVYCFYTKSRPGKKLFYYSVSQDMIVREDYDFPDHVATKTANHPAFSPFYVSGEDLCFAEIHNGNILTIDPENLKLYPRYIWDFGEHNPDLSLYPDNGDDHLFFLELENRLSQKYPMYFTLYGENERYFYNVFFYAKKPHTLLVDKLTGEYRLFSSFEEGIFISSCNITEAMIYTCAGQFLLNACVNPDLLDEKNRAIYDSIENADETPVIIKYVFKNANE